MEALCKDIRELAQKRNEILAENRNLEHCIKEVKDEICTIQGNIRALKKELPCLKKQYDQQFCCCDEENRIKDCMIQDLQCELKRLGKKNTSLQVCGNTLQNEIEHCRSHVHALENCSSNLSKKARDTECILNNLRNEKNNECTITELKEKVNTLKMCLDQTTGELQEKCYQRDCVLQNLQCIDSERDKLECQENELQKKIIELQENSFKYQSRIRCECVASAKLQENMATATENSEEIQNQLKCYEKELCKMQEQRENFLREIRKEIHNLRECFPCDRRESNISIVPTEGKKRPYPITAPCNCGCRKQCNSAERGVRRGKGRLNTIDSVEIEIHHRKSSEDFRTKMTPFCGSIECVANYRLNKRTRSFSGSKKNCSKDKKNHIPTKFLK
ncbi:hypothetical protein WDU94_012858 [Cyamophila willieti]